jgi:hypothetical protein
MLAAIEYGRLGGWYARDLKESPLPKEALYPLKQLEKKGKRSRFHVADLPSSRG